MLYQPCLWDEKTGKRLCIGGVRTGCQLPQCNRNYGLNINGRRYHATREIGQRQPVLIRGRLVTVVDYAVTIG